MVPLSKNPKVPDLNQRGGREEITLGEGISSSKTVRSIL
jgi:hypothetical protein